MKKRSITLAILLLLVALLVWWRWPRVPFVTGKAVAKSKATVPAAPKSAGAIAREQKELDIVRELAEKSNKPIQFYGLVLDQNNNPVPDVKVTFSVRATKESAPGMIRDEFDYPVVNSDVGGRFALVNAKGALLSVKSLEKVGYEASEKSMNRAHYWYWSDPRVVFHPDREKPEVFHMWKKRGAEHLVVKSRSLGIPYDGTPVGFDLQTGENTAVGGDFSVVLVRSPQQIEYGQRNFEWTITISAPGGVFKTDAEQAYYAPDVGYQPSFAFHMPANDPQWSPSAVLAFYIKMRNGTYGRVILETYADFAKPMTALSFRAFINPSGSRNLEYDPAQDVLNGASRIRQ